MTSGVTARVLQTRSITKLIICACWSWFVVQRNLEIVFSGSSLQVVEKTLYRVHVSSRQHLNTCLCPANVMRSPLLSFPLVCKCVHVVCRQHDGGGAEIVGLFCTRKDSINTQIMALCIVRWPCGNGGTGSIRCRPISLLLTLTVPTNIR